MSSKLYPDNCDVLIKLQVILFSTIVLNLIAEYLAWIKFLTTIVQIYSFLVLWIL